MELRPPSFTWKQQPHGTAKLTLPRAESLERGVIDAGVEVSPVLAGLLLPLYILHTTRQKINMKSSMWLGNIVHSILLLPSITNMYYTSSD